MVVDTHGVPPHTATLANSARGAVADDRVRPRPEWQQMNVAVTHVEGHTAAIMRQRGIDHVALVITARPSRTGASSNQGAIGVAPLSPAVSPQRALGRVSGLPGSSVRVGVKPQRPVRVVRHARGAARVAAC
jgi:hypothetical protein